MFATVAKRMSDRATPERKAKMERFMVGLGYAIVAIAVVGGFVLSFWPRAFGLEQSNPAIGFGLAVLAGFRLWVLRREVRRQAAEPDEPPTPAKKKSRRSK